MAWGGWSLRSCFEQGNAHVGGRPAIRMLGQRQGLKEFRRHVVLDGSYPRKNAYTRKGK